MFTETPDAAYVLEVPLASAPEWGRGKSRWQVGRFEAILFAPDMKLMLRLEASRGSRRCNRLADPGSPGRIFP